MLSKRTHQSLMSFIVFLFILSWPVYAQQRISSTWTGKGSDSNYSNTDNWAPPFHVPPKNFGPFVFDVTIPAGAPRNTILMDLDECVVGSLTLGEGKTFSILKDKSYTVTGQADIYGIVNGIGGDFSATDAAFPGNKVQILAEFGSQITLTGNRADQYSSAGLTGTTVLMSAKGMGSRLDLSSMTNLNAGFNSGSGSTHVHTIIATGGGQIDISGVQTIIAPIDYEDRLNILLNDGAIDLSSLRELSSSSSGYTRFELANSDSMTLPALEKIAKTVFLLSNGAQLSANGKQPISYTSTGFTSGATLMSATGIGTVLDLSSVANLDAGFDSASGFTHVQKIIATEGAHINLFGAKTMTAPVDGEDSLEILVDNASMDLSSMQELFSKSAGYTHFILSNSGRLLLPSLDNVVNAHFELNDSSNLTLPALRSLINTRFELTNGAQLSANGAQPISYSSAGLAVSATLMSAKGMGSRLDLSSITNLNAGFDSGSGSTHVHTIIAADDGQIDISGVQTIIAPHDYEDSLDILLNNGAIDLSSLRELSSSGSGYTRFELVNSDSMTLPALENIAKTVFLLSNGAQLSANGKQPISYSSTGFTSGGTLMSAKGIGTVLDLSSIANLDAGFNSASGFTHVQRIIATEGAHINLFGAKAMTAPVDGEDRLDIELDNGSIDLSSLRTILSTGTGYVKVSIDNNSTLHTDDLEIRTKLNASLNGGSTLITNGLRTAKSTTITLSDPNDLLDITGDFDIGASTEIFNTGEANLILGGDFKYASTNPTKLPFGQSTVFFVGQGPQELEVGGLDALTYPDEFLQNDNFSYDSIVIGQPNEPTAVLLVDNIDNGLRGSFDGPDGEAAEALYLFGKKNSNCLNILGGSTLYLNGLHVYAKLNGVVTDLYDLFGQDEVKMAFDEGWISKGSGPGVDDPANLIENGGFETGVNPPTIEEHVRTLAQGSAEIEDWLVSQDTMNWIHESLIMDAGPGQRFADLSSETGQGAVSQTINTVPGRLYYAWFDLGAHPLGILDNDSNGKVLRVSTADSAEEFLFDVASLDWQKKTWRFVASENSTTLTFANANTDPNSAYGVMIDNVVVVPRIEDPNDIFRLALSIKGLGSVAVQPVCQTDDFQGPGQFSCSYDANETVTLTAQGVDFARWRGDIGDNDPQSRSIIVVMDNNLFIQADFMDLTVQITNIDTSDCPLLQATVLVTDPDADDGAVIDLAKANLYLYEDGVEQSIQSVLQGTCSAAFNLVLDYSGSMYRESDIIPDMEDAAKGFVDRMFDKDMGEVIKFSDGIQVMQGFTHDKEALKAAIDKDPDFPREATALYDSLWKAITDANEQSGCKAVIVMTDGLNTGSGRTKEEVVEYARSNGIPIFAIAFRLALLGEDDLRYIAEETGGLFYRTPDTEDFDDIYRKIADALNNQYTITYEMVGCGSENDESLDHELEIIVIDNDQAYGLDADLFKCPATCTSN